MKKYSSLLLLTLTIQPQIKAEGWWQELKTKVKDTFEKKDKTSKASTLKDKSVAEQIYEYQQANLTTEGKLIALKQRILRAAHELEQLQKQRKMYEESIHKNEQSISNLQHRPATQQLHTTPAAPAAPAPKPEPQFDPRPEPKDHLGSTYKDQAGKVHSYPVRINPKAAPQTAKKAFKDL